MDPKQQKRQQRRNLIHQAWEERYVEIVLGEVNMAQILGYDDKRLMLLADKGLGLYNAGKIEAARKVFKGLVIMDPWVPYFHYLLGTAHEKLGDLQGADAELGKAVEMAEELDPPPELLSFALLARGRVLGRLDRIGEALELLARVREERLAAEPVVSNTARLIAEHLRGIRAARG